MTIASKVPHKSDSGFEKPLFLRAIAGEPTERPPIWLMRQAGRYLPEYRKLREGMTMLEAVRNPEIAIEATLQPMRRFGFDAAILFSDLTVAFTPMGAPFDIKEGVGPVVESPIRCREDLSNLHLFDIKEGLGFVLNAIIGLKKELSQPLIGFTGAPFTLASYLIEGGPSRDLHRTKAMMIGEPGLWSELMSLIAGVVSDFLSAQLAAGADAVQLFDSWIGQISPERYRESVAPFMHSIFSKLANSGKPVIHFGTGNPLLLSEMASVGGDVIGVDYRVSLAEAARMVPNRCLQGNFDPAILFSNPETVRAQATQIIREGRGMQGHIFNLGHGILPRTPLENVEELVETVKAWSEPNS